MSSEGSWSFSANGNGAWVELEHTRPLDLVAYGTWGSGSLTFECSPDGGTNVINITDSDLPLTANGIIGPIRLPRGFYVRPVLASATSPSLTVKLFEAIVE